MPGVLDKMAKHYYKFITKQLRQEYYKWRYENKCPDCDSSGYDDVDVCVTCKGLGLERGTVVPEEYIPVCLEEFLDVVIDPLAS